MHLVPRALPRRADAEHMIDTRVHPEGLAQPRQALMRAWRAGVGAVLAVSMDRAAGRLVLELAAGEARVWPAVGLHPWRVTAETWESEVEFVAGNLAGCRALGEVGLDYKLKIPKELQRLALARQLALASAHGKTASVHCRFSEGRVLDMLGAAGVRAVFHWFAGGPELLERLLADGHYMSATPAAATSPSHRAAVAACRLDRLLLETDSPVEHGGRPSEPSRVAETLALVAEIKGLPAQMVEEVTDANAGVLFPPLA